MISAARWAASCALSVNLSNRIIGKCPFLKDLTGLVRIVPFLSICAEKDDSLLVLCEDLLGLLMGAIITKPHRQIVNPV
jgi:hypothetical protein